MLTVKSCGKFQQTLNHGFQSSQPKNWQNFLQQARSSKFQISPVGFVWKINCLSKKLTQKFPLLTVKSCGKFQRNVTPCFQFSLWKNAKISPSSREGRNFKFLQLVLAKRWITWPKTGHIRFLSWQWRAVERFSKIWILVPNSAYQKTAKISWSRREGQNFKFLQLVLAKRWIAYQKSGPISFLSWQWRAMESFRKIWLLVSNSAYEKMLKFLRAGDKVKISNFFDWFWLKDEWLDQKLDTLVFSHDSEELWKVSAKSDSLFPIQPLKKC